MKNLCLHGCKTERNNSLWYLKSLQNKLGMEIIIRQWANKLPLFRETNYYCALHVLLSQ